MRNKKFTFIDLFSGIGGFHLGLQRNGGKCLGFSEVNKDAISTYCDNHNLDLTENFGDIRNIESLPKHDILTAGVPCQSWSIAGKNLGFEDDRGQLWNDTIYLLNKSRPKAFIFENVKGLADPRNKNALRYILDRISKAGYHCKYFLLNSYDFGVVQNRIRVYLVGFLKKEHLRKFKPPVGFTHNLHLYDVLDDLPNLKKLKRERTPVDLFGGEIKYSSNNFNSKIHTWDLVETTELEKEVCYQILKNRRKKKYGVRDGNPLSIEHIKNLHPSANIKIIKQLVNKGILREVNFEYTLDSDSKLELDSKQELILSYHHKNRLNVESLITANKRLLSAGIKYAKVLNDLQLNNVLKPSKIRYEFKNSKISSGINGINRIYLPNSKFYSTLVASDTNDFVATEYLNFAKGKSYKNEFIEQIYNKNKFRKINKHEACRIQGFPSNFFLPKNRAKWMKLLGNSVSVPVIDQIAKSILKTDILS